MEGPNGYQCKGCGRVFSLKRGLCFVCGGRKFKKVTLGKAGTLLTFTKLYVLPMDFETRTLMLGIVELPHGVRALGQLSTDKEEIGMKMRHRWEKVREIQGQEVYGLKFYPSSK